MVDSVSDRTDLTADLSLADAELDLEPLEENDGELPKLALKRKHIYLFALFVASVIAFLYFVLPRLAGLQDTWSRIDEGNPWWLGLALLFEVASFLGYIALFRSVCLRGGAPIDWRESYQITMAGLAATRLFAAAGAGGVALTAWALRHSGMARRTVVLRLVTFFVLLYGVYVVALILGGFGLRSGVLPGEAPFGVTVVPAVFGLVVAVLVLAMALVPSDLERRIRNWAEKPHGARIRSIAARLAAAPTLIAQGVRSALAMTRSAEPGLLGAIGWWAFDIAVLWACFQAFGAAPVVPVLVMGYFVGMLANLLPLPGGIGGVEGGMIGAFIAFGVPGGLAIVAVLAYRGFSFWLPTLPGGIAYLQLRRTVNRWREA